ncbi:M1 family metallopeptidase [Rhodospirillum centenum]|uniref:Zn-dependent aminopeptidase, putative n=1 Tax=Rhodospirillum centenum (strain ATCC 51521 / SW) TaxID=414684 RepID=B6IQI8_RHOCS|nr:M1 family metallopeptidase [Rhodospirillum centenum]ACI97724.1 Zn-dependent aminopeptidase, putative [Rhodospirillum centenum SW]
MRGWSAWVSVAVGSGFLLLAAASASADAIQQTKGDWEDKFRQLEVDLPTPNTYRTASGAPGHQYWQQRADYRIDVKLDAAGKRLTASETVRYTNNSPDTLSYLWVQLDQNIYKDDSIARMTETVQTGGARRPATGGGDNGDRLTYNGLAREQIFKDIEFGVEIRAVTDEAGHPLPYRVVDTMMRIDLPQPLSPGKATTFRIDWAYNIVDEERVGGRSGYEHFKDTDTDLFFLAQWFPRMAAYTDYAGWQHKAFLGRGEFTLEFGDYDVSITVPADHIVAATGELQNPSDVLTPEQRRRLEQARTATSPVFIVTPDEAKENEKATETATRTWVFRAKNVRDFAWSSSNKFIWDAMGFRQDSPQQPQVLAMSFYPNEAEPLWSKYSTQAVVHTMEVYSKFSFPYPYPTAQSVNTWDRGGMEYPMITFNGSRPVKDKKTGKVTYSSQAKYGLIGVVIHEIGHIYFPMTVNSDERQWSWMDEGLNTFLQNVAHLEWEENFGGQDRNPNLPDTITAYMVSENQVPVMTQSDSILQFGPNAYTKPATALTILRETVLGRDLFDHAFREYATRWKFKRPTPADFFRTMEDASGVDLDWFWRGWFYTTDHVDMAIDGVREYTISTRNPEVEKPLARTEQRQERVEPLMQIHNREDGLKTRVERIPDLKDFYNENDQHTVTNKDRNDYADLIKGLEDWERAALERAQKDGDFIYFADFTNKGGLVMPLPLKLTFADGSSEFVMIPVEIWRYNPKRVTKMLIRPKRLVSIELDPRHEIADADRSDNSFPRRIEASRLELFKDRESTRNLMSDMLVELKSERTGDTKGEADEGKAGEGKAGEGKTVPLGPAPKDAPRDGKPAPAAAPAPSK